MHRITLIQHESGEKSHIDHHEAVSWEGVSYIAYPLITGKELEELTNNNTTRKRVQEILSALINL